MGFATKLPYFRQPIESPFGNWNASIYFCVFFALFMMTENVSNIIWKKSCWNDNKKICFIYKNETTTTSNVEKGAYLTCTCI